MPGKITKKPATDIEELIELAAVYNPEVNRELLRRAYEFASEAHTGQKRLTGEDYMIHPLEVARVLTELEMDDATLAAALLHDVVEDTGHEINEVQALFGSEIALLVEGVTKLRRIQFDTRRERQAENLRRMLLAMAQDLRVILIKLADRLHNMRPCGCRFRICSPTISPSLNRTCTSLCIRRSSGPTAGRWKCRSEPGRCTDAQNTAWPPTGDIRKVMAAI